ncbi:outer membrane beta-barrel protein [Pedobacter nototheniae]|uniref:outer membrane beta-barrel protein n=1 Tax=Pedobacter nototheniae TaxID=2488994 RepID=UPI00103FAA4B|nr:outer membrane beta-barrel protein [Pedobacter nototheniae]
MKTITKILATSAAVVALFFTTTTVNAQQKLGIGLSVGLPTGDTHSFAIGGDVRYQIDVDKQLSIPVTAGYTHFIGKEVGNTGIDYSDYGYIPVKAGVKYFFDPSGAGLYGLAELGASIGVSPSGVGTGFLYVPSVGYAWSSGLDLGVRYEGNTTKFFDKSLSQVALRIAYGFKL